MGEEASYPVTVRSSALAYLVAVLVTAVAAVVRFFLFGVLGDVDPYMPFIIAVMVAASYGGWIPGLLATALGSVAGVYLFVAPYFSLRIEEASEWVAVSQFVIAGATISWLCEALHRVRRCLEAKQGQLVSVRRKMRSSLCAADLRQKMRAKIWEGKKRHQRICLGFSSIWPLETFALLKSSISFFAACSWELELGQFSDEH